MGKAWSPSGTILICANLIPIGGVLLLGWNAFLIVFLFWMENLIIGAETIFRMLLASKLGGESAGQERSRDNLLDVGVMMVSAMTTDPERRSRISLLAAKILGIPFFIFHFGAFTLVQGVLILMMFGPRKFSVHGSSWLWGIAIAFFGLVLSHAVSFFMNYVGKGEYKNAGVLDLMIRPYLRVFVMQVVVIIGGMIAEGTGDNRWGVAILVCAKIIADLHAHKLEHAALGKASR